MATSLAQIRGKPVDPNALAAAMVQRLYEMDAVLLTQRETWMREYEAHCITMGQTVQVIRAEERRIALAEGIDAFGGLRVRWEDGTTETINTGEVSVRGMYGYL